MNYLLAATLSAFLNHGSTPPAMTPFVNVQTVGFCARCGCRGGPGWRSKRTGQCVGKKRLAKECGSPPSPDRCLKE